MKMRLLLIVLLSLLTGGAASFGYTVINIWRGLEPDVGNVLGLAVNPHNGHTFVSTLSYGGQSNLYEFDTRGNPAGSHRVAFDTGASGNIDSLVFARDGHLLIHGTRFNQPVSEHYILEMSQDGQTLYSFIADRDAHSGLSYDPRTGNIFFVEYLARREYRINEITPDGVLVRHIALEAPVASNYYRGLAYDPYTDSFYLNELYGNVLTRYDGNAAGEYRYAASYSIDDRLEYIGAIKDVDLDRTTGLLAVNSNQLVLRFGVGELINPGYEIEVPVDIKPRACPNPLNVRSRGKFQVAICGSEALDVAGINPATLEMLGVRPVRSRYRDVATPATEEGGCNRLGRDGYTDLLMVFEKQPIVDAMGPVPDGLTVVLTVTGYAMDGTPVRGEDGVVIGTGGAGRGPSRARAVTN